jgi:hypothetical protein
VRECRTLSPCLMLLIHISIVCNVWKLEIHPEFWKCGTLPDKIGHTFPKIFLKRKMTIKSFDFRYHMRRGTLGPNLCIMVTRSSVMIHTYIKKLRGLNPLANYTDRATAALVEVSANFYG